MLDLRDKIFLTRMFPRLRYKIFWQFLLLVLLLFIYCEYLIYYVLLLQCTWPSLGKANIDHTVKSNNEKPLRVMLFADTHLLGYRQGHWFDKLRREWQMQRAFQTSMTIHSPEIIFVLGDIFDEGKWCDDAEFEDHLNRFRNMFSHSSRSDLQVVVGNHDIGFHYSITRHRLHRFQSTFRSSSVRMLQVRGNIFIMLNSMAFEGDSCSLCQEASGLLRDTARELKCSKKRQAAADINNCEAGVGDFPYSRPILLQHFPMFRISDANCTGPDSAPLKEKHVKYRPKYDCLSKEATKTLLRTIKPRLVMDGHSHHFCKRTLSDGTPEWTIPSFSWRNINTPSFLLAVISNNNYAINKCYLPQESTVINSYIVGGSLIGLWILFELLRRVTFISRTRKTH